MKNLLFVAVYGIVAVLMMSCVTVETEETIRNSEGYNYTIQTEENRQKKNPPDWVSSKGWRNWLEKEKKGEYMYFLGRSSPAWNELIKEEKNFWTDADAANQALRDAMRQITDFIQVEIKNEYEERIREASKQGGVDQNGKTVKELKQYQAEEESLLKFNAGSHSTFEGLKEELYFSETLERTMLVNRAQKKITLTRCWIIYSISKEDIAEARKKLRESKEEREEKAFKSLSRQYDNVIIDLENPDISTNMTLFGEKYQKLLIINARLKALDTLETRNDTTGENYRDLLRKIGVDIRTYNPTDMQGKTIEGLRIQLAIEKARTGYNLQTQTIFISFPLKPAGTEVSEANIFAANDMVSNIDYISFTNINGVNNLYRAEKGLYTPVISISWNDAARYCNWLSRIHGLTPCYDESGGRITKYNHKNNGYRLPEEHEITAMLNSESEIINKEELSRIAIWSSTGFPQEYRAYILSGGAVGRQPITGGTSDAGIGFRVVRNAQ
jgi:hypothetical protein